MGAMRHQWATTAAGKVALVWKMRGARSFTRQQAHEHKQQGHECKPLLLNEDKANQADRIPEGLHQACTSPKLTFASKFQVYGSAAFRCRFLANRSDRLRTHAGKQCSCVAASRSKRRGPCLPPALQAAHQLEGVML